MIKPNIKLNSRNPIVLCNKCGHFLCYVSYINKKFVVREPISLNSICNVGDSLPLYCTGCTPK